MAKVGRNDPCPCGSEKKYKKCCGGNKATSKASLTPPPMLNPSLIAQQWLKGQSQQQETVTLFMDHFERAPETDLKKIVKMGKVEGETVVFYQGQDWIGEADLSLPGQLVLTTADSKHASVLRKKLTKIPGLEFRSRTEDKFEPLSDEERARVSAGMLDFKTKFFKTWLDESNERLDGKTPRQAVKIPSLKIELMTLLKELEQREAQLPKKERYSFKQVRSTLGL